MFTSAVKGESQKINLSSLNSKYLNRGIGEDNTEIMTRSVLLWFCLFVCLFVFYCIISSPSAFASSFCVCILAASSVYQLFIRLFVA